MSCPRVRADRIYTAIDRAYTLVGLLRFCAKQTFDNPVEADGFRNGVALVAQIIEIDLTPLLEDAVEICAASAAKAVKS